MRKAKQKKRGQHTRNRKKLIWIGTEGRNKTERLYFSHFNQMNTEYVVHFAKGNDTDPYKIATAVSASMGLPKDRDKGDRAFCVFDTDVDPKKEKNIQNALSYCKKQGIETIYSNPCFEIWYLLHYTYSTRSFRNNEEILNALMRYVQNYQKNQDYFESLFPNVYTAIKNAKRLEQYHAENNHITEMTCNPSTQIYKIVELFVSDQSK